MTCFRTIPALFLAGVAFCTLVAGPRAHADGGVGCLTLDLSGACVVWANSSGSTGGSDGSGSGSSGGQTLVCRDASNRVIPCKSTYGTWDGSNNCYVQKADPQPPFTDPIWAGATEGVIYRCIRANGIGEAFYFWRSSSAAAAAPNPRDLAQRAVESMQLSAIRIGSMPWTREKSPESMGIVGWDVWLWVDQPNASTYGPITKTASAGGYTVTATAKVAKTVWNMGDGHTVTCSKGTPYAGSTMTANRPSPNCGYTYTKDGDYTITATTHWNIAWNGIGQSGTIPMQLTSTGTITIAEIQVVNVPVR